jgi:hypothetical protein
VLPSGIATDAGARALRGYLFDCADVDSITGLDNHDGIFPYPSAASASRC